MASVPILAPTTLKQPNPSPGVPGGQATTGTGLVPTGTVNPGTVAPANPYIPPALPGGTAQTAPGNWANDPNSVGGDLAATYGQGTGAAVAGVLSTMGTQTDQAVQATINNTNLEANKQLANIQANEAASGITPNSSTAALAAGDFESTVNSQLQQTISGMELGEEDTLLSTLTKEGEQHGPDESTFDSILSGITDAGEIAGGVSSLFIPH